MVELLWTRAEDKKYLVARKRKTKRDPACKGLHLRPPQILSVLNCCFFWLSFTYLTFPSARRPPFTSSDGSLNKAACWMPLLDNLCPVRKHLQTLWNFTIFLSKAKVSIRQTKPSCTAILYQWNKNSISYSDEMNQH